jgi:hypothetical protein
MNDHATLCNGAVSRADTSLKAAPALKVASRFRPCDELCANAYQIGVAKVRGAVAELIG